ncbi:MAG TPA: Txe/YoeB family addiction module toxin [Legionella sp.]|nr:Txe/YoeB family addiction module toxin [Legionella sp.]
MDLSGGGLKSQEEHLLHLIKENPYQDPPPYKHLVGDLAGAISRRINIQHRLVYQVLECKKNIKIIRMWSNYD